MPISLAVWATLAAALLSPLAMSATLIVANKSEASVSLHSLPGGKEVARLATGDGPHEVAVSPNGKLAVVTDYGTREKAGDTLTVIDIEAAVVVRTITLARASRPHGIEWLDESRVVVTAEGSRSLLLVNVGSGQTEATIAIDQDVGHMVAASAALGQAFVANIGSGTATAVDLGARKRLSHLPAGEGSEGISLAREEKELWITNREADTITIFATGSLEKLAELVLPGFPIRAETDDPRGLVYITQPREDALSAIDINTRQVSRRIDFNIEPDPVRKTLFGDRLPGSSIPIGVLLSGDGETLFVAHSSAHLVSVWEAANLKSMGTIPTGLEPDGMAWSPLDVIRVRGANETSSSSAVGHESRH